MFRLNLRYHQVDGYCVIRTLCACVCVCVCVCVSFRAQYFISIKYSIDASGKNY
jgi:hypothetical protein